MATSAAKKPTWNWLQDETAGSSLTPAQRSGLPSLYPTSYFRPFSNFFQDIERLFDNNMRSFGLPVLTGIPSMWSMQAFSPALNIASNDNEYIITVEVPGMDEKDIRLDSQNGLLTISGEKRQESEERDQKVECMECSYGMFQRTLTLPEDADQEHIEADFKNGVLTITCPRTETAKSRARQIPIGSGRSGSESGSGRGTPENRAAGSQAQGSKKAA